MELIINDVSFDITLYNTNFVDYWINRVFKNNNVIELTLHNDGREPLSRFLKEKNTNLEELLNKIYEINKIINKFSFEWVKPFPIESFSQEWLCKLHEQWAETTLYMEARKHKQYGVEAQSLANELNNNGYWKINPLVHSLEYINRQFRLESLRIFPDVYQLSKNCSEYTVKATDTSFLKSNIVIPFNDVGRPQFEEWLLKNRITNETSNYSNISGYIDILFLHEHRYPNNSIDAYKIFCDENTLEAWGPMLNIGQFSNYTYMTNNLDKFWYAVNIDRKIKLILKK